jgi:hypothetical protein
MNFAGGDEKTCFQMPLHFCKTAAKVIIQCFRCDMSFLFLLQFNFILTYFYHMQIMNEAVAN